MKKNISMKNIQNNTKTVIRDINPLPNCINKCLGYVKKLYVVRTGTDKSEFLCEKGINGFEYIKSGNKVYVNWEYRTVSEQRVSFIVSVEPCKEYDEVVLKMLTTYKGDKKKYNEAVGAINGNILIVNNIKILHTTSDELQYLKDFVRCDDYAHAMLFSTVDKIYLDDKYKYYTV